MIRPGDKIGHIRIDAYLAEGGMGAVYVGFDEKLERQVALKAIRSDRLDARARARFLVEARLLSQLDHPNICRIHGYLEDKRGDFLILELIRGRTLRQALSASGEIDLAGGEIDREGIDRGARLALAEAVARALEAAHEKGIIHRDLKLDNVMVTEDGTAKVLDFGLARLETDDAEDASGSLPEEPFPGLPADASWWMPSLGPGTELGALVGTPSNMSPEQARGEPATAASDAYSLGLLLQELFTGRPPYESGLSAHLLLVKAAEGDTLPVENVRDPDLTSLLRQLKALAPEARPTVAAAAERLAWIRGKPRRLRLRLLAAAVAVAFLLGGVKYTLDLRHERQLALEARNEAEQVTGFLVDLFRVSDPQQGLGPTITAREILDQGAVRLDRELAGQPRVQARMLQTIGAVYQQLGLYDRADPLLKQALETREKLLGGDSPEVAESLESLGRLAERQGRFADARPLLERSLALREAALGPEAPQVAESLDALASLSLYEGDYPRAKLLWRRSLGLREKALGPRHPRVAELLHGLANAHLLSGEEVAAEKLLRRALQIQEAAFGPRHPQVAQSLLALANLHRKRGDPAGAEPLYRRALAVNEEVFGPEHPIVAKTLYSLAICVMTRWDLAAAEPLFRRALEIRRKSLGPDHPDVAYSLDALAGLYVRQNDPARAEPLLLEAVSIAERALGPDHPNLGYLLSNLGLLLEGNGELARAETYFRRALAIKEKGLGPDHLQVTTDLMNLAAIQITQGHFTEARTLYLRARDAIRRRLAADPKNHTDRLQLALALVDLGRADHGLGLTARAEESWREALAAIASVAGGPLASKTQARALLYLGRIDEARPLVKTLQARGWQQAEFLRLCRKHGL